MRQSALKRATIEGESPVVKILMMVEFESSWHRNVLMNTGAVSI